MNLRRWFHITYIGVVMAVVMQYAYMAPNQRIVVDFSSALVDQEMVQLQLDLLERQLQQLDAQHISWIHQGNQVYQLTYHSDKPVAVIQHALNTETQKRQYSIHTNDATEQHLAIKVFDLEPAVDSWGFENTPMIEVRHDFTRATVDYTDHIHANSGSNDLMTLYRLTAERILYTVNKSAVTIAFQLPDTRAGPSLFS